MATTVPRGELLQFYVDINYRRMKLFNCDKCTSIYYYIPAAHTGIVFFLYVSVYTFIHISLFLWLSGKVDHQWACLCPLPAWMQTKGAKTRDRDIFPWNTWTTEALKGSVNYPPAQSCWLGVHPLFLRWRSSLPVTHCRDLAPAVH